MKLKDNNVFQKLQTCRVELQKMNLKKTGKNAFAGFTYYELGDFLPQVNELFLKNGLASNFSIFEGLESSYAELVIINSDKPEDKLVFRSPIADANIKGCTPVQSLGGVHTYLKRYLYINALEIVENDMFDGKVGDMQVTNETTKQKVKTISPAQKEILEKYYVGANLANLLANNKIERLEDLPLSKGSAIIKAIMSKKGESKND